jgi:hypothetical protein
VSGVGGKGIPRVQDLSYIEVAVAQIRHGASFEAIRRALVTRAAEIEQESDFDGSFNERRWERLRTDSTKNIYNTVDALKELMRLGWVEREVLPSSPKSAYAHADTTFKLTITGEAWAMIAADDRRAAYTALISSLIQAHPQFEGYLRIVGARPDSTSSNFTIPLLRYDGSVHRTHTAYLEAFIAYAQQAVQAGVLGWKATSSEIDSNVRAYVTRIEARARARGKELTRKQFTNACEESICRTAFAAAGSPTDYVTLEVLRQWTRFLGVANFSYYAPGPPALRLWATADVVGKTPAKIERRVGRQVRQEALQAIWPTWMSLRADGAGGMYLPIWKLRAAVCWRQRISDDEFDRGITEYLAREHGDLGIDIHLDQASLRSTPASTRPLIIPTTSGLRRRFNVINVTQTARS